MKTAILMLGIMTALLFAACTNSGEQNKQVLAENQSNAVATKNSSGTTGTVEFAANKNQENATSNDEPLPEFSAEGSWSKEDSKTFYLSCNRFQKEAEGTMRVKVDRYCDCVREVMIAKNYRPTQLTTAVKAEANTVKKCLLEYLVKK